MRSPPGRRDPRRIRRPSRWAQHDGAFSPTDVPATGDTAYTYSYTPAGRTESLLGPELEETYWGYLDGVLDYEEVVGLYTRGYAYDPATMQTTGWTDDNGTDFRTVSFLYSGTRVTQRQAIDGPTIETQSWSDWDAYGTPRHTTSAVGFDLQAEEFRTTDDLGRIVSTNHSIDGTPLGTVTYGYTDNGSVASVSTTWAGGYELFRSGTGLVNEVHDLSTHALLAQIDGRDALGRPTHAFTVDGQIARAYDQMGRDTWFSTESGALVDKRAYEYDDLGRASFVHHEDAEGIWLQEFVYENPGRLTHDIRSTGTGTTVYAWDAAGNRTSITKDGGATMISTYDNADRLLTVGATTLAYDPFGGIIDDGAGFGIPRGADGAEIGVAALSGSTVTPLYAFWRNAGGEPVATEDVDGLHRQVWGNPGTDLPLAGEGPEGNWLWLAVDGIVLGQLRDGVALGAASDPSGSIAYFHGELAGVPGAFGEGAGLADVRHAWTGMETLPGTPYQLAQHRLYDTANGRFTVNDPIGLAGGDNRYAYAGGDPVQFVDPSGLAFAQPGPGGLKRIYEDFGDDPNFDSHASFHDGDVHADQPLRSSVRSSPTGDSGAGQSPAEDSCSGGIGCPPSGGEPGDEGDGTGTYGPRVPVLNADADGDEGPGKVEEPTPDDTGDCSDCEFKKGRVVIGFWKKLKNLFGGGSSKNDSQPPAGGSGLAGSNPDPGTPDPGSIGQSQRRPQGGSPGLNVAWMLGGPFVLRYLPVTEEAILADAATVSGAGSRAPVPPQAKLIGGLVLAAIAGAVVYWNAGEPDDPNSTTAVLGKAEPLPPEELAPQPSADGGAQGPPGGLPPQRRVGGTGWRNDVAWKSAVRLISRGGTIRSINGKIATQQEARDLIAQARGRVVRVDPPHEAPNPHSFPHIHYTTPDGSKGTIEILGEVPITGAPEPITGEP